ncbi:Ferric transport system permease protein [Agrobacterium fabacearum CFBP 5771]|jgi:iron(III) transport system permease protein|uniref:ABC transporter permease n=1 Tax=Agrobacterium tumefaciens TaxID=358 RepID=A0AB36EML5_AGRTU|nr:MULTISPECIES: iron ABC transporter permease [Rhizobium/Agrobacterium group]KQY42329.1 ABC transporter permease [Rhizobium sp. Root491]MDR5009267.1 iron ABC transporter permease [Agrobacterium tumefaciens]MDX8325052.1 iron ABC transporter permease [Agrobacterium tumefaciens]NSY06792.1 iron ABC transporter permease [Agrobacterium tumefaciens]NSY58963.1 iron ABC transporter permease [Agrobacterium tumefaciens]
MSRSSAYGNSQPRWLFPFVVSVVFALSALPLGRLAYTGIVSSLNGDIWRLLADPALWDAALNTLSTSFFGMLISLMIGGGFALALTLCDIRGKSILSFLFMLPMMIPPQVTALSWIGMTGPSSTLLKAIGLAPPMGSPQPLYSIAGIALLLGVQHAPLVYLSLRAGLLALPQDGIEAAKLSGASPRRVLFDIILPLSTPGLIAGAAISFVSNVGNFGIPAILGIPASIFTLPTLIYSRFASFGASTFGDIAILSTMIAIISVAGLALQERAMKGRDYRIIGLSGKAATFKLSRWRVVAELVLWLVLFFMLVAPLAALVASSLAPAYGVPLSLKTVTMHAYEELLYRQSVTRTAFRNSLFLATVTSLCLLAVTVLTAYFLVRGKSRFMFLLSALVDIPYALPGVVISVSFVLLFAAPIPLLGITLYGTIWIILLAYFSSFFAVSLKPMVSAFLQFDPSLEEAARLSGAGFWRRLKDIILPLVGPAAGASVILVFLIACNELTVSALLWSAGTQTLGVLIYNLDDSGSFDLASALSVLVVIMVIFLMLLLEILGRYLPKGVVPWRN